MGSFIAKQPNGLICRFSSVVDAPTDWNMTPEDYADLRAGMAREEAYRTIQYNIKPFEWVEEYFRPGEMTKGEFKKFLKEVSDPVSKDNSDRSISVSQAKEAIDFVFQQLEIEDKTARDGLDPLYKQIMLAIDMLSERKEYI